MPPPTVQRHEHHLGGAPNTSRMMSRPSWLAVMSRNTNSSALALVPLGDLNRVARVAKVDEIGTLTTLPRLTSRQGIIRLASISAARWRLSRQETQQQRSLPEACRRPSSARKHVPGTCTPERNECCSGEPLLPCSYCHAPQDPVAPAQPRRTLPEMASGSVLREAPVLARLSYILQESLTVSSAGPCGQRSGSGSWISSTRPAAPHARRARAGRRTITPRGDSRPANPRTPEQRRAPARSVDPDARSVGPLDNDPAIRQRFQRTSGHRASIAPLGSRITTIPWSLRVRIRRPNPCLSLMIAEGT